MRWIPTHIGHWPGGLGIFLRDNGLYWERQEGISWAKDGWSDSDIDVRPINSEELRKFAKTNAQKCRYDFEAAKEALADAEEYLRELLNQLD